ncbi:putative phage protein [Candidatus Hepatincola sp. Pdp]
MNELLEKIKAALTTFNLFNSVEIKGFGLIGIDGFNEFSGSIPTATIGICAIDNIQQTPDGMLECGLNLSIVFSATVNYAEQPIFQDLKILENILLMLNNGCWNDVNLNLTATKPYSVKATNYYEPNLYNKEMSIWRIDWVQKIKLGQDKFLYQ